MAHSSTGRERSSAIADADVDAPVLEATRDLLWIEGPADARAIAVRFVASLGGVVVPARDAGAEAIPIDVSFGDGEPALPSAPTASVAHMRLTRHLPAFVRAAHRALELVGRTHRLVEEAEIDHLTGLPSRRRVGRTLGRLRPGDVVIMLDLDEFKALNDTRGHQAGDEVLRALGRAVNDTVRARDHAGRYGGEEFVVILPADLSGRAGETPDDGAEAFLTRLLATWEAIRPYPVTFSAGYATVGEDPSQALAAADGAMYAAKRDGRDRWYRADDGAALTDLPMTDTPMTDLPPPGAGTEGAGATDGDAPAGGEHTTDSQRAPRREATPVGAPGVDGFVAFSHLSVPEAGSDDLIEAFGDRLGRVERWPGFRHLEVWQDHHDPTVFVMVTWWEDEASFRAYMGSDDHRRSHARISSGPLRPRPETFVRYRVVAR